MDSIWEKLRHTAPQGGVFRLENRLPYAPPASDRSPYQYSLPEFKHIERRTLLQALAKTLQFPDYFGGNWDAAYDCLTDRTWEAGAMVRIDMHITAEAIVDEDSLTTLVEVMQDASRFWNDQKVTLYFLLTCPRSDLIPLKSLPVLHLA